VSEAFFDFVRGRSDVVPAGYAEAGMRAYRHLVWLGACQMVDASFPQLREQLGEAQWQLLLRAFVRDSTWSSPFYGDVSDAFMAFVVREAG
jgi:hypothetical protein